MPDEHGRILVALLAVPEVTASALFGMYDLFSSPGRDFSFLSRGETGEQRMRPFIVARTKDRFQAANSIPVLPDHDFADSPMPDIVCIPDFFIDPGGNVEGQYQPEADWLAAVHHQGGTLASACSGAVLLGEAGLLKGREATIHWAYVQTLAKNYPGVQVRPNQTLVLTGEAHRIVMAGGGTSWQDLSLYLIARHVGLKEAIEVARVYLLQWHDVGQLPFAAPTNFRQSQDGAIGRSQDWVALNYHLPSPVGAMIAVSGLSERSFMRRFRTATGMTPLDYVHAHRLEEAKQMLERSDLAIEAIAEEVGYEDTSFFGRLFHRRVGLTPRQYRLRFGSLRRALTSSV